VLLDRRCGYVTFVFRCHSLDFRESQVVELYFNESRFLEMEELRKKCLDLALFQH
jgi:hypothetical protein